MRGSEENQGPLFSYVSLESRIPPEHPIRAIRKLVDEVLKSLDKDFEAMYALTGRPSIPPQAQLH